MQIDNSRYGGFMVSKNVCRGIPIRYSFREKSEIGALNGWNYYSEADDDEYVNDPDNFVILSAESMMKISKIPLILFNAPYGTDLCWLYEKGVLVGFYDLKADKETTIEEILRG